MNMRYTLVLLALISIIPSSFFAQRLVTNESVKVSADNDLRLFVSAEIDEEIQKDVEAEVLDPAYYTLNSEYYLNMLQHPKRNIELTVPLDNEELILELTQVNIFAERRIVRTQTGKMVSPTYENIHYWGTIQGMPNSKAAFSIMETGIMGMVSFEGQTYEFVELVNHPDIYVVYETDDLKEGAPYECFVSDEHSLVDRAIRAESSANNPDNCVQVYVEVDHTIFLDKNADVIETANYVEGAFAQVFILYDNEDINVTISELVIWDTPDPYDGPSSGDYLGQFRTANAGNFNGDIAHLVSYGGGGGVAYLNVLCNQNWGFAYSGIGSSYNDVPAYSWTVMVIAHEIGHNIGSPHTHSCNWNGNNTAIDGCASSGGGCPDGPLPVSGTIMSYCHLQGGIGIDFVEGFHPQVQDLFQDRVYTSTCLSTCYLSPEAAVGVMEGTLCPGGTTHFWDASTGDVIEWDWSFPGGSPSLSSDPNPSVTYSSPGVYNATLEVTSSTGENSSMTIIGAVTVQSGGDEYPLYQDFESGLGDWTVENPGGGLTWELTQDAFGARYGDQSIFIENYNNAFGQEDLLVSPEFSLLAYNTAQVHIDYAYATASGVSDSLIIEYSIDGGNTYQIAAGYFENGSSGFASAGSKDFAFYPWTEEDWCFAASANSCLVADISGATREHNVRIRLRNLAQGGNNLYIDRVWVTTDCYDLTPPQADFTSNNLGGCAAHEVQFTDLSQGYPIEWDWSFPGGTPSTSTEQNPVVVYENAGIFEVSLTAINPEGSTTEYRAGYIFVDTVPLPDFQYTVTGLTVSFENLTPNGVNYQWNFGDGTTTSEENPEHTYSEDGIYSVILWSSNPCGTGTLEKTVELIILPMAEVEMTDTTGCYPLTISYSSEQSEFTDAHYWEFEGGSPATSTEINPVVTYDTPGIYDVLYVATNANGTDTIWLEDAVSVLDSATANFDYSVQELQIQLENLSSAYDSLVWVINQDTFLLSENPSYQFDETGTYEVMLIAFNASCGNDTSSQNISVWEAPVASLEADLLEGCIPLQVQFQSTTTGVDSFRWVFEGGNPAQSSMEAPFVSYNQHGSFDVMLIVQNPSGLDTLELDDYIQVYPDPTASFTYERDQLSFTFENTSEFADSFVWDFGDGTLSNQEHPQHVYASEGSYEVELIAYNQCDSSVFRLMVNTANVPVAAFEAAGSLTGCTPYQITFVDRSTGQVDNRLWTFEGGNPAQSTDSMVVVTYDQAGTYDVLLEVENSAGSNSFAEQDFITVIESANGDFTYDINERTVSFDGILLGDPTAEQFWDFGDGNSSDAEDPTHQYQSNGTYSVWYIVSNACSADSSQQDVMIDAVSISFGRDVSYKVYPNPIEDILNVESDAPGFKVVLYNADGTFVSEHFSETDQLRLNLAHLPSATYIMELKQGNESKTIKLLKQ